VRLTVSEFNWSGPLMQRSAELDSRIKLEPYAFLFQAELIKREAVGQEGSVNNKIGKNVISAIGVDAENGCQSLPLTPHKPLLNRGFKGE